ncbi:MAG: metallophosphoesterase [Candidatus Thermoplasmatota archaeon]|jgi:putative SbcD/Mre11-related phosphoesterase|nr:metallophosphoesterase [Candidatus Thermoplasmatota archaeon]
MVEPDVFITDLNCIYLADINSAVISDLHLGFEEEMNLHGLFLPKLQLSHVRGMVDRILDRYQPENLIINGDFKHEFSRNLQQEWQDIIKFLDHFKEKVKLTFVKGNHDNYLISILKRRGVEMVEKYQTERYFIYHGDRDFGLNALTILGHEHPSLVLRDRVGGLYKVPAFVHNPDSHVLITPAMSYFSSGSDVVESLLNPEHFTPVLKNTEPGRFRVYGVTDEFGLVDFGFTGDLKKERTVSNNWS